jgi:hypothetical protein
MRNSLGVETHAADLGRSASVILGIRCVGEEEFGPTFGCVHFDRQGNGGADEDAFGPFLGHDQFSLLDAKFAAQTGGDNNRPAFSDFTHFHRDPRARMPAFRSF